MNPHVPLGSLGTPGLPLSSYEQLVSPSRTNLPWPAERPPRPGPTPRRGLLRRVGRLPRLVVGAR
ncbi:hypothetical protein [Microlunatus flavus]|uniref:Uncharacterized protein n=1 Tax=Microlunatus flavus TaxID=1036181 RepID=A0A1H8ZUL8_9ACTN|nr:hypothetical protein [Microlunatus flavus]SEP68176.1 hypothetical protein SAMN05421756_101369 [Microlunatus flavus]